MKIIPLKPAIAAMTRVVINPKLGRIELKANMPIKLYSNRFIDMKLPILLEFNPGCTLIESTPILGLSIFTQKVAEMVKLYEELFYMLNIKFGTFLQEAIEIEKDQTILELIPLEFTPVQFNNPDFKVGQKLEVVVDAGILDENDKEKKEEEEEDKESSPGDTIVKKQTRKNNKKK